MWILTVWSNWCKYFCVLCKKYTPIIVTHRIGVGFSSKSFFLTTYGPQSYVFINPIFKCLLIHFLSTPSMSIFEAWLHTTHFINARDKKWTRQTSFCPHGVYDLSSLIICLLIYNYIDFLPFWILPAFIFCFVQFSILISWFLCREVKIKSVMSQIRWSLWLWIEPLECV